jgi:hypothetical protein
LQQQFPDLEITKDKVFTIEKLFYSGDMGGILCTVSSSDDEKTIISITHLKIDSSHPLADRIQQYQRKRMLALAIANGSTRRSEAKSKRKRRGFGN